MNPVWRHMALAVFEKQDPEDLTLEEIDLAIEKYPYFPVLHYIKAAKLRLQNAPEAPGATARAALYFPNPHWLEYQLDHRVDIEDADESLAEILTTPTDTNFFEEDEEIAPVPEAEIDQEVQEEAYDDKRIYGKEEFPEQDIIVPAVETSDEDGLIIDEIVPAVEVEEADELDEDEIVPAVEVEELDQLSEDEIVPAVENNWEDETLQDEVVPAVSGSWQENEPAGAPESSKPLPILPSAEAEPESVSTEPGVNQPLIPIEPLYTIDYFASQGIKLPVDEIPSDQLGKKLKSFTEWLKSMKKLQPDKVDRQMDSDTENHIRKEAEHSNDSEGVYTEALAEVYLKQGLEDKAVEVFKKLSLLDPSKSAYFAARIREIKEI